MQLVPRHTVNIGEEEKEEQTSQDVGTDEQVKEEQQPKEEKDQWLDEGHQREGREEEEGTVEDVNQGEARQEPWKEKWRGGVARIKTRNTNTHALRGGRHRMSGGNELGWWVRRTTSGLDTHASRT